MDHNATATVFQCCVTVLLACSYLIKKRKRRIRRWWVRPINQRRIQQGDYNNLLQEMRLGDVQQFFLYTRMTPEKFDQLLSLVGPSLKKNSRRQPLSEGIRLSITLRHLATGDSLQSIAWAYRIGKSTCCNVIYETTSAIWDVLSPIYIPEPGQDDYASFADNFADKWNLWNCVGSIDGKHITIQAPNNSGSNYFNYKKHFSIVLLAVCNADYIFTHVDIGAYGSQADGGILRNSEFGKQLFGGTLPLPPPTPLPFTTDPIPYFFAADEAFGLHTNILRPFPGKNLPEVKQIFNYRLSRARRVIENAFGILAARWRIFHRVIGAQPETVDNIVKATICLHNFLKMSEVHSNKTYCPPSYTDVEINNVIQPGGWRSDVSEGGAMQHLNTLPRRLTSRNSTMEANRLRELVTQYLSSRDGAVDWQWDMVRRGLNVFD